MSIITVAKSVGFKGLFVAKKYAPEILTATGVVALLGGGVLAAKQTLKLEAVVHHNEVRLERAREIKEETGDNKPVTRAVIHNIGDMTKLYGAPVGLAVGGVVCILTAHGIMRKRNAALVAAYNVLKESYDAYRDRVREVVGEETEEELYRGIRTVTEVDPETGKKTKHKVMDENGLSPYARVFAEDTTVWFQKGPGYNRSFLELAQSHLNDLLQARGFMFLNEVYARLGFEPTAAGQVVGWVVGPNGDSEISFNMISPENHRFNMGYEDAIWLDFNVDGVITDNFREL